MEHPHGLVHYSRPKPWERFPREKYKKKYPKIKWYHPSNVIEEFYHLKDLSKKKTASRKIEEQIEICKELIKKTNMIEDGGKSKWGKVESEKILNLINS